MKGSGMPHSYGKRTLFTKNETKIIQNREKK
jgi:hypothetical protein